MKQRNKAKVTYSYTTKKVVVPQELIVPRRELSHNERLTMSMQLAVINWLLYKATTTYTKYERIAFNDIQANNIAKIFSKLMKEINNISEGLQLEMLKNKVMTNCLYTAEKMINPYVDKVLNYLNFENAADEKQLEVLSEGHYEVRSLDKDPFNNSYTTLDLIITKQGKGYRCISTDGTFKNYSYKHLKNKYSFFKINN